MATAGKTNQLPGQANKPNFYSVGKTVNKKTQAYKDCSETINYTIFYLVEIS